MAGNQILVLQMHLCAALRQEAIDITCGDRLITKGLNAGAIYAIRQARCRSWEMKVERSMCIMRESVSVKESSWSAQANAGEG